MPKTLLVAEKPSVGQDLARVLGGKFKKHEGYLEGPDHVITWAVGHLVQLAEPEAYDKKFKSWKMETLPIVPEHFKLEVRDERSRKQMSVVGKQLHRDDVETVINACDAGREGELIFAYVYEQAGAEKPVRRLWLNSMTNAAIKDALGATRPAAEFEQLEQAARSRSEADWIVGMNATRAATIRLRSSFDGAVSLGRVQTPTLAILVKREEEIKAFTPEPYWLVDATFAADAADGAERRYVGHYGAPTGSPARRSGEGAQRLFIEQAAQEVADACRGRAARITKLESKQRAEATKPLYDLTSLQRDANTKFGFSARRTLAAAQRLYDQHKALTYPRTNSKFLTSDMVADIKPIAACVGEHERFGAAAKFVVDMDILPLERVVNDEKVGDHHAIIPTCAEHNLAKMDDDDLRVYELVVRRYLAAFYPDAVFENTRIETTVDGADGQGHVFKSSGKVLVVPGWRAVYERQRDEEGEESEDADQNLPRLTDGEPVATEDVRTARKETKPPRRLTDASLLDRMETAGQDADDDKVREAMADQGIGTPATRAAIIERLITVGYVERDGRALVATEKGLNVIRLLDGHDLTSPELTGKWEQRLARIERGEEDRAAFMHDIATFAGATVRQLDETLKDVRIPRARLGPCPVCGREIVENRKGYSCWAREDPGCGFVIWKAKAGKNLPVAVARELIKQGYTNQQIAGFRGRTGRIFRARLALSQTEDGKWRVEFDEPWAREGAKPPDAEAEIAGAVERRAA
ncbi:MAG TPA: DNA topoisomerase 3 [Solirubrobacteraceae bacterium]|nr:DNA topoisomerase 3 [Solirubrobacteraceae bacterium]